MISTFSVVQEWVLAYEGGYVNHPKDPGGATNKGVTQRTYNAFLSNKGLASKSVKLITDKEVKSIYYRQYFIAAGCDQLPLGLDFAVYDFAVNSGVSRAVKTLQMLVGAKQDGIIGSNTLAAVKKHDAKTLITRLCNERMAFLKRLRHWPTFGKGWTRRVMGENLGLQKGDIGVIDRAHSLIDGISMPPVDTPAPGKAPEDALGVTVFSFIEWLLYLFKGKKTA